MSYFVKSAMLCSLVAFTAACGGSSTTPNVQDVMQEPDGTQDLVQRPNLAELRAIADTLSIRAPETFPQSGSADFEGVLAFTLSNGETYDGLLSLAADLSNNSISGTVTDFINLENGAVGGTLTISNGFIDRSVDVELFFLYRANIDGVLTDADDRIVVDGIIGGQFLGGSRQVTEGRVVGDVYFNGTEVALLNGAFAADCVGSQLLCESELNLAPQTTDEAGLAARNESFNALRQTVTAAPFIEPSTLVDAGTARFEGIAQMETFGDASFIGDFSVDMDFGESTFSGEVTNVLNEDAHVLDGNLLILDGSITRTGDPTLTSSLQGTLNDANSTYVFDGSLEGFIRGEDHQFLHGFADGSVEIDGVSTSLGGGFFQGVRQ